MTAFSALSASAVPAPGVLPEARRLPFRIDPQPDEVSCGATCLHAIYRYHGDPIPLDEVRDGLETLEPVGQQGTLAVLLANHALRRGYRARLYTWNLSIVDPTWFRRPGTDLRAKLAARRALRSDPKLVLALDAFATFLDLGGELRFRDLNPRLIRKYLDRGCPILTGLSSTYLYQREREIPETLDDDDVGGEPAGHFVVLSGYERDARLAVVADPYPVHDYAPKHLYEVPLDRLINAILLGVMTYDGNLLVLQPGSPAPGTYIRD